MNDFSGDGILTAIQISKYCKSKNTNLQNWLSTSFCPFPQKLTNINIDFSMNKINQPTKDLILQTIESCEQSLN